MALWNTGRFDDIRLETEPGSTGLIVRFVVTERRVVRSIKYEGIKSVTVSEILDRFKERKVGLSRRIAVRSEQGAARRGRAQGVPGRARPPVRRRGAGDPPDSALLPRSHLQRERRSQGQGRRDRHSRATRSSATARCVRAMKNLRPIGIPALDPVREHLRQDLRLHQARRGQGPHPRLLPAERLLHGARARSQGRRCATSAAAGFRIPLFKPEQARASAPTS